MAMLLSVCAVMVAYIVMGQLIVRAAVGYARTSAPSHREVETPRRLLRIHIAVGLALVVTVTQMIIRPGEPGRVTTLKFFPLLAFTFAAALLPEAQYRRATRTAGITYQDIAVAFARDAALRVLQGSIVFGTATAVFTELRSLAWIPAAGGLAVAMGGSLLGIVLLFAINPHVVRLIHRGRPLEDPRLTGGLQALAVRSGLALPRIFVLENRLQYATAMITGILPGHRFVFISDALLRHASPGDVVAVVAHELAHLRNRDTLRAFRRTLIGFCLLFLAAMGLQKLAISLGMPDGPLRVILTAALPGWIIAMLFQLPASRRREAAADRAAASWVGEEPLADALARLYEINAMNGHAGRMARLLASHPALEERLLALGRRPAPGG